MSLYCRYARHIVYSEAAKLYGFVDYEFPVRVKLHGFEGSVRQALERVAWIAWVCKILVWVTNLLWVDGVENLALA